MSWLTTHHIQIGGVSVSIASLLISLAILLVGFTLASRVASRVRGSGRISVTAPRWRMTLAQATAYAIRLGAVTVALQVAGVDIGTLLAASAVVAVGIGIAMQKVAENFVSGVILMAERSIREGDIVEFDGQIARVQNMGIRATIALTLDDVEIIVPNSMLTQSAVKNLTLTEGDHRLRVHVGVAYASDLAKAEAALRAAAESCAWRDATRPPIVLLEAFGSSSVDFEVSVWTRDVWGLRKGKSDLRKAIWRALKEVDVTIAFPQLDVHLDHVTKAPPAYPAAGSSSAKTPEGEAPAGEAW